MKAPPHPIPSIEITAIDDYVAKTEVIQIRVTPAQKREIKISASSLRLTTTEYLIKCHELIAQKLRERSIP